MPIPAPTPATRRALRALLGACALGAVLAGAPAAALAQSAAPAGKTFRFATLGDYKSLDPYSLNESFANGMHTAVYEGLIGRDKDLKVVPALAERWETLDDGKRWRFHLRKGVKFSGGEDFTADDVVFSSVRVRATGSNFTSRLPSDAQFVKVDDHTVDCVLTSPNPLLINNWHNWFIMSKAWAEKNGAQNPTAAASTTPGYAALNSNGTGPFVVASHQPGVKTVWRPNPTWWGKPEHNLSEAILTTVGSDPTRVAALLSGEVDLIEPAPLQDVARINANAGTQVLQGPELRTIYFGFDQRRDELKYSNVKGKNPFKDVRVRQAFVKAVDAEAIKRSVMRGASTPTPLLITPLLFKRADEFKRPPVDVEGAKKLLTEAGYPQGFEVTLDCPNDRYVNDEAICQALVGMLGRVGVKVNLLAQPKAKFFAKILNTGGYDTSFYMLGWTPDSFDSTNVTYTHLSCRNEEGKGPGETNGGGYCNPEVDALIKTHLTEPNADKREDIAAQIYKIALERDQAYLPLHQQALAWGVSKKLKIVQRADNNILFQYAVKE